MVDTNKMIVEPRLSHKEAIEKMKDEFIMNLENVNRDQVIAVGDGSTSSHFIKNGGLSIAFKPGEIGVKTDGIFSSDQIINLLYCLGIPKTELDKYLKEGLG